MKLRNKRLDLGIDYSPGRYINLAAVISLLRIQILGIYSLDYLYSLVSL